MGGADLKDRPCVDPCPHRCGHLSQLARLQVIRLPGCLHLSRRAGFSRFHLGANQNCGRRHFLPICAPSRLEIESRLPTIRLGSDKMVSPTRAKANIIRRFDILYEMSGKTKKGANNNELHEHDGHN